MKERADVLVLGAGAAGLAAARDLSDAGLRVTVVEARGRVGGRILTQHDPRAPIPLELGAEFVHGEAPETMAIARAAGLTVLELPDLHETVTDGRFYAMDDFWETVNQMNADLGRRVARRRRDFPVSEYLATVRLPARRRGMLQDFVEGFYAAHPERLSAKSLAAEAEQDQEHAIEGRQFRIAGGYDGLVKSLRDMLDADRTEVRLGTIVQVVRWKRGNVRIVCQSGRRPAFVLSARAAIITLPHAVLKSGVPGFEPAIPSKQRALAGIETGHVFKIVLRFRQAFWEQPEFLMERRGGGGGGGGGGSDGDSITFLHAHGLEVPTWWTSLPVRAPMLTGWVGGARAEALLVEEPVSRLERSLVALSGVLAVPRRDLEVQLDAWTTHDWRADPFARGAYSYIGVGGSGAPRVLARPVEGTMFFAGEATNGAEIGTVSGALASGRRAAREVLQVLP